MMFKQATDDLEDEDFVDIRYRLDGSLFNLRRQQAHTNTYEQLIKDLLFADDAALVAHTERALQRITSCFAECAALGTRDQPEENRGPSPTCTSGSILPSPYQHWRIGKATRAFGRLYKRVWQNCSIG